MKPKIIYTEVVLLLITVIVISTCTALDTPKRILVLNAFSTRSEGEMFFPLINELAKKGHQLTVVSSDPATTSKIKFENVTSLVLFTYDEIFEPYTSAALETNVLDFVILDKNLFAGYCHKIFENADFKAKVLQQKFDMILLNVFVGQCFYGLAYKDQASLVLVNTFQLPNYLLKDFGSDGPTSITPYPFLMFTDQMSFAERLINFVVDWITFAVHELIDSPLMESVYRKHLGQHYPSIREINRNVSLVLVNTDPLATPMVPLMPEIVQVGGLQCRPPLPLPKVNPTVPYLYQFYINF